MRRFPGQWGFFSTKIRTEAPCRCGQYLARAGAICSVRGVFPENFLARRDVRLAAPPTLRPAACRGTARRSCDPAEAQLAEALPAGLAALPEHSLPPLRRSARCLPGHCLPVLRPCGGTTRRSAVRRSCGPPEHCLPERCLPKYRQLTSAARPKFRLPVLRLCRSTARRSAARRPRYAKKRSSSSRAAMSDSAMRRLSFDLSV